jgi:hypothetical protein
MMRTPPPTQTYQKSAVPVNASIAAIPRALLTRVQAGPPIQNPRLTTKGSPLRIDLGVGVRPINAPSSQGEDDSYQGR